MELSQPPPPSSLANLQRTAFDGHPCAHWTPAAALQESAAPFMPASRQTRSPWLAEQAGRTPSGPAWAALADHPSRGGPGHFPFSVENHQRTTRQQVEERCLSPRSPANRPSLTRARTFGPLADHRPPISTKLSDVSRNQSQTARSTRPDRPLPGRPALRNRRPLRPNSIAFETRRSATQSESGPRRSGPPFEGAPISRLAAGGGVGLWCAARRRRGQMGTNRPGQRLASSNALPMSGRPWRWRQRSSGWSVEGEATPQNLKKPSARSPAAVDRARSTGGGATMPAGERSEEATRCSQENWHWDVLRGTPPDLTHFRRYALDAASRHRGGGPGGPISTENGTPATGHHAATAPQSSAVRWKALTMPAGQIRALGFPGLPREKRSYDFRKFGVQGCAPGGGRVLGEKSRHSIGSFKRQLHPRGFASRGQDNPGNL